MKKTYYWQEIIKPKTEEIRYLDKNYKVTEKDFFIGCPDEDGVSIDKEKGTASLKGREALGGEIDDGFEAGVVSSETKGGVGLDNKLVPILVIQQLARKMMMEKLIS